MEYEWVTKNLPWILKFCSHWKKKTKNYHKLFAQFWYPWHPLLGFMGQNFTSDTLSPGLSPDSASNFFFPDRKALLNPLCATCPASIPTVTRALHDPMIWSQSAPFTIIRGEIKVNFWSYYLAVGHGLHFVTMIPQISVFCLKVNQFSDCAVLASLSFLLLQ